MVADLNLGLVDSGGTIAFSPNVSPPHLQPQSSDTDSQMGFDEWVYSFLPKTDPTTASAAKIEN